MAPLRRLLCPAVLCATWVSLLLSAPGGAGAAGRHRRGKPLRAHTGPLTTATWVAHARITEYFAVPERWFSGRRVPAPGLDAPHRVDWLYSAHGVAMEGDGVDLEGRPVHADQLGSGGWINSAGHRTRPTSSGRWSNGTPFWRAGAYWLTPDGALTFPLEAGGWSAGPGTRYVAPGNMSFAPGPSRPLVPYGSVAVDRRLIPLGSRVLIPAYRDAGLGTGWFVATDTGGAIIGRHLDVYRPPPSSPAEGGRALTDQRVYVVPPHARPTAGPTPGSPSAGAQDGGSVPTGAANGGIAAAP